MNACIPHRHGKIKIATRVQNTAHW